MQQTEKLELFCDRCHWSVGFFTIKPDSPSHDADRLLGEQTKEDGFICSECSEKEYK